MNIRDVAQPGDVFSAGGKGLPPNIFKAMARWPVIASIHGAEKRVFGKKSKYLDHHTMIYFGENELFSVELPSPKFISVKEYDNSDDWVAVYRFLEVILNAEDIEVMKNVAIRIINEKNHYDVGQLLDILIGVVNGYPYKFRRLADAGKKNLVCSVGVATIYNAWRKWRALTGKPVSRLFSQINPQAWSPDFVTKFAMYGRWDIESTMPSNFSNTETHFRGEFKYIGTFKNGIQTKE